MSAKKIPKEIRLSEFYRMESERYGVALPSTHGWIKHNPRYRNLKIRRVNKKENWVLISSTPPFDPQLIQRPMKDEVSIKEWVADEAERRGVGSAAIYQRIQRGKYPGLKFRRVNRRVVFVKA